MGAFFPEWPQDSGGNEKDFAESKVASTTRMSLRIGVFFIANKSRFGTDEVKMRVFQTVHEKKCSIHASSDFVVPDEGSVCFPGTIDARIVSSTWPGHKEGHN